MLIKYGCVTLRPIEEKDFGLLFFMMNDPDISSDVMGDVYPITSNQQMEFIRNWRNSDKGIKLMIELSNGKTIGMVTFHDFDWRNRTISIGYKIHASVEDRIRGDMKDVVHGMLRYSFYTLGMNCVYGITLFDNIFALKLLKKTGFKQDGVLRSRIFQNGIYKDVIATSILRSEYDELYKCKYD